MTTTPDQLFAHVPAAMNRRARHPLSKDIRADAYPMVPAPIRELVRAEDELTALLDHERSQPQETYPQMVARVADALVAGESLPDDLTEQAQRASASAERLRVTEMAVSSVRDKLEQRWSDALREHADDMLTALASRLDDLLTEVRAAAVVVDGLDLTDPEAVGEATAKQRQALATLKALRPRYRNVRHLQESLMEHVAEQPPTALKSPSWRLLFRTHVHEFSAIATHGAPADDLPSVLWFRRLTTRGDVWLPTLDQLARSLSTPAPKRTQHTDPDPDHQAEILRREAVTRTTVGLAGLNH